MRLHGFWLCPLDRESLGIFGGSGPGHPERGRSPADRGELQRAGAGAYRAGPFPVSRSGSRPSPRNARPAGHAANPRQMGRSLREPGHRAAKRRTGLSAYAERQAWPRGDRDAVGEIHRNRDAASPHRLAAPARAARRRRQDRRCGAADPQRAADHDFCGQRRIGRGRGGAGTSAHARCTGGRLSQRARHRA